MNLSLLRTLVVLLVWLGHRAADAQLLAAASALNDYADACEVYAAHAPRHDGTQALAPAGWLPPGPWLAATGAEVSR